MIVAANGAATPGKYHTVANYLSGLARAVSLKRNYQTTWRVSARPPDSVTPPHWSHRPEMKRSVRRRPSNRTAGEIFIAPGAECLRLQAITIDSDAPPRSVRPRKVRRTFEAAEGKAAHERPADASRGWEVYCGMCGISAIIRAY